jgi:hypothetical protein
MEIGGYDLIFEKGDNFAPWDLIQICRKTWTEAVVQFDPEPGHFFMYKDMSSATEWEKDVPTTNASDMIYFIIDRKEFTAVVGDLNGECVADLKNEYNLIK